MFEPGSRYFNLEVIVLTEPNGREVTFVRRRFVPDLSHEVTLAEHIVGQGDRLDTITARYLNDPEQFWRVCDANNALNPTDLTSELGRRLRMVQSQY